MSTSLVCPHCGYANPEGASFCADCAGVLKPADPVEVQPGQYVRRPDTREAGSLVQCSSCNIPMEQTRDVPFRIGGYVGARRFAMGDVAELAEHLLSVDLYLCPKCGSIRMYANPRTRQGLPRAPPRG
jgi:predicted RNA-binding Zn-ribbon protein involved in translation (DUF1610 family)